MGGLLKYIKNKINYKLRINRPTVVKDNIPQMRFKQHQTNGLAEKTIMPLWPTTVNTLEMKMIY